MKRILIIIIGLCISMYAFGQGEPKPKQNLWNKLTAEPQENGVSGQDVQLPVDPSTNKVAYKDVIETPGQSQKALFDKSKKWLLAKNTEANPYTITYESDEEGTILGKGRFALPGERRKYVVQFSIKIMTKANKYKYEFTDLMVQYFVPATATAGGFGYFSSSSRKEAENLEYSIETFYPARMHGKQPAIKFYEEINRNSFTAVQREMESIANSLKQSIGNKKEDW